MNKRNWKYLTCIRENTDTEGADEVEVRIYVLTILDDL